MQFQGKRMIQTQENDQKRHFRPDLCPLVQNLGLQNFKKLGMVRDLS